MNRDMTGDGMVGALYYNRGHVTIKRSWLAKVLTAVWLAGIIFIVFLILGNVLNVNVAQKALQSVIGGSRQVEPEQTKVAPPRNVNSQQTAYFDYEGGPKVVKINYPPVKMLVAENDTELFTCPKLIVNGQGCQYHNGVNIRWRRIKWVTT